MFEPVHIDVTISLFAALLFATALMLSLISAVLTLIKVLMVVIKRIGRTHTREGTVYVPYQRRVVLGLKLLGAKYIVRNSDGNIWLFFFAKPRKDKSGMWVESIEGTGINYGVDPAEIFGDVDNLLISMESL